MNKFGTKLDGGFAFRILQSKHAAADPAARLKESHFQAGASQLGGCGQSCGTGSNYDDIDFGHIRENRR